MKVVNKNIVLIVIGIMIFILGQIGVNYFIYKDKNNVVIPKVKLKDQEKKKDTFAIMLEQDDGTYQATESTSFNQPGYEFNSEKSGCIDVNGNKIDNALSYNDTTKAVVVNVDSTSYCYVYFDKFIGPNELITTLANPSEIAYDGTADNNLRYIGKNPNNYIYFNCSDYNNPTASTCEKWRIIGAFNNMKTGAGETKTLLKIIRSERLGSYYWDYKQNGVGSSTSYYGSNDWSDSQLMLMLNGVTLGNYKSGYTVSGDYLLDKNGRKIMNISGSYYEGSSKTYIPASTSTSGYSSTETVDFSNTGLKNDTTRGMIENVVWKLGGSPWNGESNSSSSGLASQWYSYERGTQVYNSSRPTEWTGKIGLMYISDFGYATSGGAPTNREACLATELYNWSSNDIECVANDWVYYLVSLHRTLTSYAGSSDKVYYINPPGSVILKASLNQSYSILPCLYLTSNIGISAGYGTIDNPYILSF